MTFLIGNTAYIRTVLMAVALGLFFLLMYKFAAHAIVDRYVMAGHLSYLFVYRLQILPSMTNLVNHSFPTGSAQYKCVYPAQTFL